jgi:hypothetical protein
LGSEPRRAWSGPWSVQSARAALGNAAWCLGLLGLACSSSGVASPEHAPSARADAPVVAAQPGAWFDAYGNLTVVGAGRRLRLVLSAPIAACSPAFQVKGSAPDVSARASLPFQILNEACRDEHPSILLAEESETASPSELERSYHEVAHCAATDFSLTEGWIPDVVAASDPCPLALGLAWRLPHTDELQGLTIDDRKAVAGALFDTEGRSAFGGLLLYARATSGELTLATLSPNAAEVAPTLAPKKRSRAFFGAALRCVRDGVPTPGVHEAPPVLPGASECLRAHRQAQREATPTNASQLPELQKLKAWLDVAQRAPQMLHSEANLKDLSALLAAPALDGLAQQAREERALTERYAELAEGLDDPAVSEAERERRHAEFAHLRKRLGGQIVHSAEASGTERTELGAVLQHLLSALENAAFSGKGAKKGKTLDYAPLLTRVRELGAGKAPKP